MMDQFHDFKKYIIFGAFLTLGLQGNQGECIFYYCHKCTQMADTWDRHNEHPRLKCLQHHNLGQRRTPNFLEYISHFSGKR